MAYKRKHVIFSAGCIASAFLSSMAIAETLFKQSTSFSEFREVNDFETSNWIEKRAG